MSEQPLSPQGYNIKDRPVNANPFWDQVQGSGIGDVTASAETVETGAPATARVESVDNPDTGKTDLRFSFGIPAGRRGEAGAPGEAGEPGEAGAPGRGIGVVAAETNTGSGVGVRVSEAENVQNNEVDLTFHFDFPTEGGSQSLEFKLLGVYEGIEQPSSSLVSQLREYPVAGFGVAYRRKGDNVPSRDIQALIPTRDLTTMKPIHLSKTFPTNYGCNAVLCVTVSTRSNGSKIVYDNDVKYMAPLIPININGTPYYVNATSERDPSAPKYFGLCVWGIGLKEGSAGG